MRGKEMIRRGGICAVLCVMLMLSACGITSLAEGTPKLSDSEKTQVTALLGDLNGNVSTSVVTKLGALLHETKSLEKQREDKGDYQMSEEEYVLWEKITALLDKETIRQFGKDEYIEDKPDPKVDNGKEVVENLKRTLSADDWKALNKLRTEYFQAIETEDENYDVDIDKELRNITEKYDELDSDALVLNLIEEKSQKPLGMFTISPKFEAIYQDGRKNGLKSLTPEEQKSLEKTWKATTDILPLPLFENFQYFKVGGDGRQGTYAYVIPVDLVGAKWCLTVDPADVTEDGLFPYTAVHEMVHYVTLNQEQVDYIIGEESYYPHSRYSDWQCVAKEDSYLQSFYQEFWKDIINDWSTDPKNIYFYYRHQSEFVTGYSSTECAEDLAESFSAYVFLKSASTPETQAKLDFFERYPEFRQLKQQILEKVRENHVYINPEIEPESEDES